MAFDNLSTRVIHRLLIKLHENLRNLIIGTVLRVNNSQNFRKKGWKKKFMLKKWEDVVEIPYCK